MENELEHERIIKEQNEKEIKIEKKLARVCSVIERADEKEKRRKQEINNEKSLQELEINTKREYYNNLKQDRINERKQLMAMKYQHEKDLLDKQREIIESKTEQYKIMKQLKINSPDFNSGKNDKIQTKDKLITTNKTTVENINTDINTDTDIDIVIDSDANSSINHQENENLQQQYIEYQKQWKEYNDYVEKYGHPHNEQNNNGQPEYAQNIPYTQNNMYPQYQNMLTTNDNFNSTKTIGNRKKILINKGKLRNSEQLRQKTRNKQQLYKQLNKMSAVSKYLNKG